nr:Phosphatidyl-myo-inositol mannosyltransferase [Ipomoea batatas]
MGSLESGPPLKRDQHHQFLVRSSSASGASRLHRLRSRCTRVLLFKKIDYLQWICTVGVFFFFVVVFQMLLPGSLVEKSENFSRGSEVGSGDLELLKELGGLDFGEDVKFEPSKLLHKFKHENGADNGTDGSSRTSSFAYRKPKLGLVFANMLADPYQVMMLNVALALKEIGYEIEVLTLEDGSLHDVWRDAGLPVSTIETDERMKISIDWLNYDALLLNSLEVVGLLSCFSSNDTCCSLMQEPFKSVPVIWTIQEHALAAQLRQYKSGGQNMLVDNWRKVFSRANVVVFPNYVLPMAYSTCDTGNYFVIPGSTTEVWEADNFLASHKDSYRTKMGYGSEDFIIAIVGSQLLYKGLWLEQALVLQALLPIIPHLENDGNSNSHFRIIVIAGGSNSNYSMAVEAIAQNLKYPNGMVKHFAPDEDTESILSIADIVIYASFREEESFPSTLLKAMRFGKPIIAPDLSIIKKNIDDRVNGYLYPKQNVEVLTQIMAQAVANGKLSLLARNAASIGKQTARNVMVSESVEGYALLLENILRFSSEAANPQSVTKIPLKLKSEWQWHLFEAIDTEHTQNRTWRTYMSLNKLEKQWNHTEKESSVAMSDTFVYSIWEEEKYIQMANRMKRREDDELKGRTDQSRGTWEEVYKSAKRADRSKNDLHERDEGELERTGQPLCIYEPYYGEGTWPFLQHTSLYRGLGLSTKGRRPGYDDIDAPSRLPLLNNPYYRDVLYEFGGFFAIANRIDRIHKNAWIGFQSWRVTARKGSLSKMAETALLDAIEARRYGDTLFFWVPMDMDPRNPQKQDFWSFCDAINAGNCKFAFSEAMKKMYGIKQNISTLPSMPADGGTWSVMHSWVLPTRSFLEFVMFSRMFVDALDSEYYDVHHQSGYCHLSLGKDKHCYSRMLELLINVWAYHSARRMVYVDPKNGLMEEQHKLKSRKGHMWVKWFHYSTLKSLDEELAEVFDSDRPKKRWVWPSTGEVFWQGILEKERNQRNKEKEKRRQQSRDKISRIRKRSRQKVIGKYVKPPPEPEEDTQNLNATQAAAVQHLL